MPSVMCASQLALPAVIVSLEETAYRFSLTMILLRYLRITPLADLYILLFSLLHRLLIENKISDKPTHVLTLP